MGAINVCNIDNNKSIIIESKSSSIVSNDFCKERYSVFEKIQDQDKLKDYIPYQQAFQIGAYLDQNLTNCQEYLEKVDNWRLMANKCFVKATNNLNIQKIEQSSVKVDSMIQNCLVHEKNQFYQYVMEGPPEALRWCIWKTILKVDKVYKAGVYEKHLSAVLQKNDYEQIRKDILRTFPEQYYFSHSGDDCLSIGHEQMVRVLSAVVDYFPSIGYCQGMNFLIGYLLLVCDGSEFDVFWAFIQLVQRSKYLMIGVFCHEMPLLQLLEYIAMDWIRIKSPLIYSQLIKLEIPKGSWLTKWLMTVFLDSFPTKICTRIWDYFICGGIFYLIQIIIPILDILLQGFQEIKSDCEGIEFFHDLQKTCKSEDILLTDNILYLDMDKIIQKAQSSPIKKKYIQDLSLKYLKEHPNNNNIYAEFFSVYTNNKKFNEKVSKHIKEQTKVIE